jgi:hypothetical protein
LRAQAGFAQFAAAKAGLRMTQSMARLHDARVVVSMAPD